MTRLLRFVVLVLVCGTAVCSRGEQPTSGGANLYAPWPNGPPTDPAFFPISVWWQAPALGGRSGPYPTLAAAAAAARINIFLGLSGESGAPDSWPERFGADLGELEAIKANKLYVVGGIATPHSENSSAASVASMLALARSIGATSNLIGYNAGDEPNCEGQMQSVPAVVAAINAFDPTRVVLYNHTAWMKSPQWSQCLDAQVAALKATSIGSFDLYPLTDPWLTGNPGVSGSDFAAVPNDTLFLQGLTTRALVHFGRSGQPMWVCIEAGGDNLGFAEANNRFKGALAAGSNVLVNQSGWSRFTGAWVGLTVNGAGIPTHTSIVRVLDGAHAVMSAAATATAAGADVTITGGVHDSDCVASVNLCVVNGNEYRPTPAQVSAEVWMSIINGARGVIYFCHDLDSASFCLGDAKGGAPAAAAAANLGYIDSVVLRFAPVLNAPTAGDCSMQQQDFTTGEARTTTACSGGILSMATGDAGVPGMALVKQFRGATYVFAQSDRRSAKGAAFTFTLEGLGGKTARVVYDSDERYAPAASGAGFKTTLSADGVFRDTLGAHGADYEVKVYEVS
jgi:hypothetical protein